MIIKSRKICIIITLSTGNAKFCTRKILYMVNTLKKLQSKIKTRTKRTICVISIVVDWIIMIITTVNESIFLEEKRWRYYFTMQYFNYCVRKKYCWRTRIISWRNVQSYIYIYLILRFALINNQRWRLLPVLNIIIIYIFLNCFN